MAFQFKPYQSVYVDPKRAEIAALLRERYLENLQASDDVQTALDEMLVSNFEGDKKLAKELRDAVGGDLEKMSQRADYENLGLQVHKTAKNFNKGYRPIEENYNQFMQQKQAVEKMYEDGRINSDTWANVIPGERIPYHVVYNHPAVRFDPSTNRLRYYGAGGELLISEPGSVIAGMGQNSFIFLEGEGDQ